MKILCIQLKQLGDVLITTPSVRALAKHYPGCQIDFMTQRPADSVYRHSPYISKVYCVKWKLRELLPLLRQIYRERYDLLVDFSGSSKTAAFAYATRIPRRLGFDRPDRRWCFTDKTILNKQLGYAGKQKLALLQEIGVEADGLELEYFITDAEQHRFADRAASLGDPTRPLIAVSPVSKREYKVWPAERFAELCDRLVERFNARIFFFIGPGEKHFAEAVQQHMTHQTLPIDDSLSLDEAACLLDHAVCYLGNDNGLMHLAVARNKPTFGVFGRPKAINWASPLPLQHSFEYDPGCKNSCHYPDCGLECLTGVEVDRVWSQLETILSDKIK